VEALQHDLAAFDANGQITVQVEPQDDGWWLVLFDGGGGLVDWPDDPADARAVLWILADKLQDSVEETFRDAWPRCPRCRRSLCSEIGDRDSVWRCPTDGWACPIGDFGGE
jgi:hypothetical protein